MTSKHLRQQLIINQFYPNLNYNYRAKQCNSLLQNSIKTTKLESSRNYASSADTNNKFSGLWNFTKRWDIGISIGIGVSLIAIFQWRHLRRHPYPPDSDAVKGPISDLMVYTFNYYL